MILQLIKKKKKKKILKKQPKFDSCQIQEKSCPPD